jgi:hypothetical protein
MGWNEHGAGGTLMDNGKREFDELRNILQKLDRSLDEAQHKRQHGNTPPAPTPGHTPGQTNGHMTGHTPPAPTHGHNGGLASPAGSPAHTPASPAVIPDQDAPSESQPGRLKAKPLRRNRPENTGPSHGWMH